jgi:hypothetical protein
MVKRRSTATRLSMAERFRAHRQEMELAMEQRISLPEARALIEQRAARQHWEQTHARLQAKVNGQAAPAKQSEQFPPSNGPPAWMLFD